jgi:hypothetical protein
MKKIITLLVFSSLFLFAFSQQDSLLRNKGGKIILPQKGDYAVGISVNSIFNYVGNMFSSSGNNQFYLNLLSGNNLYGKYFLSSQSAIRVKFSINQFSEHYENNVQDDININNKVTDKLDESFTQLGLSVGYEKRKGSGRLQVSYGVELNFNRTVNDDKYTYGNAFSITNTAPTSTFSFNSPSNSGPESNRPLESKQDNGIGIGVRLFTG